MNARKLLTLAVAATVLVGGVAAVGAATPGNAPTDEAPDEANGDAPDDAGDADADADDESDVNETDADENESAGPPSDVGPSANASEHAGNASDHAANASDAAGERGPPTDLPAQVPEHVSSIHEEIQSFLGGEVDHLGNALSGLLGDDGETEETEDAVENETVTNETTTDENASASSLAPVA